MAWLLAVPLLMAMVRLPAQAPAALAVSGMPDGAPLTVTAECHAGTLRVRVALQDGWHLYSRDVGGGQPVTVTIAGGSFAAAGDLAMPASADGRITGKAELRLPLRRAADGTSLRATMRFMVCDALQCLPPIELELRGDVAAAAPAAPLRQRYVHPEVAPADGDWAAWYARQKDRIVWIESTGFWWQTDPRVLEREAAATVR